MSRRSLAILIGCGAVFGLSFVFVRAAVPYLGPVALSLGRTLIGGVLLLAVVRARGLKRGDVPAWRFALLGVLSAAAPFLLLSIATTRLNAGTTAVVNASSPAFALLIEVTAGRERLSRRRLAGLVTCMAGVALATAPRGLGISGDGVIGVVTVLLGAFVFAYGGSYAGRGFAGVPPLVVAAGQQLGAAAVLAPLLVLSPPPGPFTVRVAADVVGLGVLGSGLAYLLFYWLIDHEGPVRTASVNLLVPVFGVLWGFLLLGEPLSPVTMVGIGVIVIGLRWVLHPLS
ncbi:DMT family transporter [Microbispora sp. NEAU-D428]|uniref:DMT family transporter n=1 Tax=Microbispora sitophila TaxID=2771537 RepID=UPI0018669332|nr:DMT family transporter [Microbispora sitophila]MBE3015047.1 DMT family transporter [Microbispora sitophila]